MVMAERAVMVGMAEVVDMGFRSTCREFERSSGRNHVRERIGQQAAEAE